MALSNMSKALGKSLVRGISSSAVSQQSLPALATAPKPSMMSAIFGSTPTTLPPMSEPLPGLVVPEPPAVPASAPTTSVTKLANGATIASEESPGATVAVGIYVNSGSKYETAATSGASHLLERMAFKASTNRTTFRVTREAEVIGANLLAQTSREQTVYTIDCLKSNLPEAVELLADTVLNPKLANHEVAAVAANLKKEIAELTKNPAALLMEAVQATAYNGPLGMPSLASEAALNSLTGEDLKEFVAENYTAPRMVLCAAGCSHEELLSVGEPLLASLPAAPAPAPPASVYVGGDYRLKTDSPFTNIMIGFESPGWKDTKVSTASSVLTMLLGGGGSFSAGGPGKGMYSRLYTRVLNKYAWAQNCTAYWALHDDTGIIGISAMADGSHSADMIKVMAGELQAVAASGGVTEAELARAKAATKSNILMNLESKAVVAEDIGRQILTYGHRKSAADMMAEIDAVSLADISATAGALLKSNPTLAMCGDLTAAPRFEEVKALFK